MTTHGKDPPSSLDPLSLALGRRISELRADQQLAAHEFAKLAGMDANYLWRIEAGRQNLSFRNVARLAKAFRLTLSELLEGIELSDIDLAIRPYVRRASEGGEE